MAADGSGGTRTRYQAGARPTGSGTDGSPCFTPGAAVVGRASAGLIYVAFAAAVERRGVRVVWIGGEDRALNRALAQEAGIDASDAFSVRGLAELGRHARFAVTNDSGPMHVLSSAGIPLYAFFGPTSVARSHALGQRQRVLVHPVPCSPCWLPVCPPSRAHACMQGLTPGSVVERLIRDGLL